VFYRHVISCWLNCIIETIQVAKGRMFSSPGLEITSLYECRIWMYKLKTISFRWRRTGPERCCTNGQVLYDSTDVTFIVDPVNPDSSSTKHWNRHLACQTDFLASLIARADGRMHSICSAWRLAGQQVHGGNAILTNKKKFIQAAALHRLPLPSLLAVRTCWLNSLNA